MGKHYSPNDNGNYYVEPYVLIGHDAADVMAWVAAHPEYRGAIEFERWDFEGSVDVTEFFRPEVDEADVLDAVRTVEAA